MSKYFPKPIVPKQYREMDAVKDAIDDLDERMEQIEKLLKSLNLEKKNE